ncbi:MAG: M23 family metallopeptidase [Plectolyngbya sp. WJT66-NPBG17]|jgi:murein DD-endopeptidase MepM/ murein hydrolase activator NlpD|nr:M23 family metallopeptidase [Plectolyngbya sp. WJT66-NPBG17]MBW4524641.1 M23 family metallopeptidase [Phormidium tanganyikae FI6-MK23]
MTQRLFNPSLILRALMLSGLGGLIGFSGISRVHAQSPTAIDAAPKTTIEIPKIAAPAGDDAFIDRTDYSLGATERSEPSTATAKSIPPSSPRQYAAAESVSVAPVEVGGFNLSVTGINWNAAAQSNPIGSAYGTVQTYYNRTVRPIGRMGNGDLKLIFPLAIPAPITSIFGWRVHPISGNTSLHTGTDIGAPMGTPVLAALTGRVIMSDFFGGYGLAVALEHNAGAQQTLYAHLSEIFVKPGDIVKQGTVLGRVGSTGNSTGPHLHFEVRQQTTEGWVAMDAGGVLETAMADLAKSMQVAQKPQTGVR